MNRGHARIQVRLAAGVLALAVLGLVEAPPPAFASCLPPPPLTDAIASARVAFVGTVTATSNAGRTAQVRVESIWKGARLPSRVEVRGSPSRDPDAVTSVDRRFDVGQRYLFVPPGAQRGPTFTDSACSSTSPFDASVAALAPPTTLPPRARGVEGSRGDGGGATAPLVAAGVVVAAASAMGVTVVRRRRRHPIAP